MKKLIIIFGIISFTLLANGQFSAGISGGTNVSRMSINLRDLSTFGIKPIAGFNINLIADYKINSNLTVHSGISLSQKGFKQDINFMISPEIDSTAEIKSRLNYLEIPIYLQFNTNLNNSRVFYALGPFLSYGLDGKTTTSINGRNNVTYSDDNKFSKNKNYLKSALVKEYGYTDIKRFDYGIGTMFGFELNHILLSVSYQYSLQNLMIEYYLDEKMSNSTVSVSIGYIIK